MMSQFALQGLQSLPLLSFRKLVRLFATLVVAMLPLPACASYSAVTAVVRCVSNDGGNDVSHDVPSIPVNVVGRTGPPSVTDAHGHVVIPYAGDASQLTLIVDYNGKVEMALASGAKVATSLQVINDLHNYRNERASGSGMVSADKLDLGTVELRSLDCDLWNSGVKLLQDFHRNYQMAHPAGRLRIKRWDAVVVGGEHTYYDYLVVPTDAMTSTERPGFGSRFCTIAHEFGHSVRHVLDGDKAHWDGDLVKYAYGRKHDGNEIYNIHYAFNEGWANYWALEWYGCHTPLALPSSAYRDWNEWLVGERLVELHSLVGASNMLSVLRLSRERIHSLHDFEAALWELRAVAPNAPSPVPVGNCPPAYVDDGATCRRDAAEAKPSYPRGAGSPLSACGAGQERSGALCYPVCQAGFHGVGPVCWSQCPAGYADDGATCRRDAHIISADNSSCPGYDKCGLTFSKGCSKCPPGYSNDGCTCRVNVDIRAKQSVTRGAGEPMVCEKGLEQNAALCYEPCKVGFTGVGPVCWGACPPGTDDHGGTCFRGTSILIK